MNRRPLIGLLVFSLVGFASCQWLLGCDTKNSSPTLSSSTSEGPSKSAPKGPVDPSAATKPGQKGQKGSPLPLVAVAKVEVTDLVEHLELTGSVEAERVARLASPAEGPVLRSRVREGDRVKAGQFLLSIGRKGATDALAAAAAEDLSREKEDLQRIAQLVEGGALPKEHLEQAQGRVARAAAQVAAARQGMDDHRIVAPWDGVVSGIQVMDGDYVGPRTILLEMFDPGSLVIRFSVPEVSSAVVSVGDGVFVVLDAFPGQSFQGEVSRVYPELNRRNRTRTVEAKLANPMNSGGNLVSGSSLPALPALPAALIPGMFARLTLSTAQRKGALVVSQQALVVASAGGARSVFAVRNGKAIRRPVETGLSVGGRVEIVAGLKEGELVVVAGNEKLKDGQSVRVAGAQSGQQNRPKDNKGGDR